MGRVLAAYGNNAFQEFIMPQVNDADFSITLSKSIYGFDEDAVLNFEIISGVWRFVSASPHVSLRSNSLRFGQELEIGSLIQLRQREATVGIVAMELDQDLGRFKKYWIKSACNLQIGSAEGCNIVYDFQGLISRAHAVLELKPGSCRIIDTSRNGVYMGGKRIKSEQNLAFGDVVNIFGLQIIWLGAVLAIGTSGQDMRFWAPALQELEDATELYPNGYRPLSVSRKRFFHRSPRILPKLNTDPIEIEGVPQPQRVARRPLLLTIGPSMTMVIPMLLGTTVAIVAAGSSGGTVSPYMYTGIVIAAASALLGVMWALINMNQSKKEAQAAEENRIQRYQAYLYGVEQEIQMKANENRRILESAYPSGADCAKYDANYPTLWNRNMSHFDVLFVRLGVGDVPFQCPINIPKKSFSLYDDELAEQPRYIRDRYQLLHNVPVGIDLAERPLIGVVGDGTLRAAAAIARVIAVQIAANNCYTDVKMMFFCNEKLLEDGADWSFAKWLPHVWSENKTIRYCACTKTEVSEICFEISEIIRTRTERTQSEAEEGGTVSPHYVIFLSDLEQLSNEGVVKHLLSMEKGYGITTLILAPNREMLPNVCEDIIEVGGSKGSIYNLGTGIAGGTEVTYDVVTPDAADRFARRISSVEVSEVASSGAIPESLTFLDMWGVKTLQELNVLERWRKNRTYETMRALIGQKAGGQDWYLDIHEKHHGPHGLVAGTTGSGKSETLQTYILSLALSYSPDDVAFFIIDYKGGGMANLFSNLPHMAGQISNLSGNQVHRAMVSIKSENRRRQRLFNECGVNHIDNYTRLYKNGETSVPLPHLLIIIDEFAELKREESSFMRELISVAQVGRSLGVHLILATQKPSGTVDDNIWSNAKFRLCLRVQDRQDSNEMLHRPDAAYITQAGRGFMQVGNDEIFEQFQSGWSGADYDEALVNVNTNIASMRTNTGKSAIIGNHLKKQQKDRQRLTWLKQLSQMFRQSADEMNSSLDRIVTDRNQLNQLVELVYDKLEKARIDYGRNRADIARLQEFAFVLAKHMADDWESDETVEQLIRQMQRENIKIPEVKGKTQLAAVVDYLEKIAQENGYTNVFRLWLPVLPERLLLENLAGYNDGRFDGKQWYDNTANWTLEAMIGLSDNPANQIQTPMTVSLSEGGNLAICGVAGSGKSTFLQTMLFSMADHYSPAYLNFYVLDFSNRSMSVFEELPHCGGVVYEDDLEKVSKCFNMLMNMMQQRKKLLRGGTYSQFVQLNGTQVPAVILAIDNFANFKEKTGGVYEGMLQTISREGENYGIYLAITCGGFGGADIPTRIADNLRNVVALEMGDKFKYGDVLHTIHFDVLPEAGVKGRGIAPIQGTILEYQTAVAVPATDDYDRAAQIKAYFEKMNAAWTGKRARKIPEIPEKPVLAELQELEDYKLAVADPTLLPYAYMLEDASICCVDLRNTYCWTIAGRSRTGKTNVLQVLIAGAKEKNGRLCVMDFGLGSLKSMAEQAGATYITTGKELFDFTIELQQTFLARNRKKQSLLKAGEDEDAVFEAMAQEEPIFLFIDNLSDFIPKIYQATDSYASMAGFYENVVEKGRLHNIYFFACVDTDNLTPMAGRKVYEKMTGYKTGIHLGGNVASQKYFDFSSMPYAEQIKPLKTGIGLLPQDLDHPKVRRVVIPKAKG